MLLFNCFIFPSPHPNEISLYKWVRTHFESLDALFCIPFWMSDCTFSQHVLEYHWSGLLTARFGISLKWSTYSTFWNITEVVYLQHVLEYHWSGLLTALFWLLHGWYHMKLLPSRRVLCTPHNHAPCHAYLCESFASMSLISINAKAGWIELRVYGVELVSVMARCVSKL